MSSPDGQANRMARAAVRLRFVGDNLPSRRPPQGLSHRVKGADQLKRRPRGRCPLDPARSGYARSTGWQEASLEE